MRPFDSTLAATYPSLIGCDEVGRGALCGPVVAAAVWFDPRDIPTELLGSLDDSKKLSSMERERLFVSLTTCARFAVAASSAACIDQRGIRVMTLDAMRRAIHRLGIHTIAKIDGVDVPPGLRLEASAVVRGDSIVPQIAAASIVAKVCRDRLMARLAARHPHFSWDRNAGYGTAQHLEALRLRGPTRHHRHSFAPIKVN